MFLKHLQIHILKALLDSNKWHSFLIVVQFFNLFSKSNNCFTKFNPLFEKSLKSTFISLLNHKNGEVIVEGKRTGTEKYLRHRVRISLQKRERLFSE